MKIYKNKRLELAFTQKVRELGKGVPVEIRNMKKILNDSHF